ncbi:MAG: Mur ligase family protein [Actinomycetota bacterium]
MDTASGPVELVELRVLEGPNLYFPRPAVKLTLAVPGWLRASESVVERAAERLGIGHVRPGTAGSEQRRRTTARLAAAVTRKIAVAAGARRLAVRARSGAEPGQIVVAFPWRRRGTAEALGHAVAEAMGGVLRRSPTRLIAEVGERVRSSDPGEEPIVPEPTVPVIQVTGTNGKTTTTRLLAHLVRVSGRTVAYSSTDGVYSGDDLMQEGDYSGFGGAAIALAQRPDVAVLETARGGILLRGIGVAHNDVAVVTNVSADHLELHGIQSVDQLSEVKATITKITRPDGWDVLNADDPRVLAMRHGITGRPWLCSTDHDHPALREVLAEGGRAMTVLDGVLTWLEGRRSHPLLPLLDVPVTIAGISTPNTHNAMGAAAAAIGIGLPERAVIRGLRTFVMDAEHNPGRANLFRLDRRIVVIDYAHNEAGMAGLTEICDGLRRAGRDVWLTIDTAGDRTDTLLHDFAYRAARGADHLAIAQLERYLRGRDPKDLIDRLMAGALDGGQTEVPVHPDEVTALGEMLRASRAGDVVGVTALGQRPELFAWLDARGAERLTPGAVRRLVAAARRSRGSQRR